MEIFRKSLGLKPNREEYSRTDLNSAMLQSDQVILQLDRLRSETFDNATFLELRKFITKRGYAEYK